MITFVFFPTFLLPLSARNKTSRKKIIYLYRCPLYSSQFLCFKLKDTHFAYGPIVIEYTNICIITTVGHTTDRLLNPFQQAIITLTLDVHLKLHMFIIISDLA